MAAKITCPRVLATEQREEIVVKYPKSLRERCEELLYRAWDLLLTGLEKLMIGCGYFWVVLFIFLGGLVILFFISMAYWWIPIIIAHCHKEPGIELKSFTIRDMTAFQSVSDSPWQVNSAFNASFSTWNTNTVTKCFTTYRRMDVRVEYHGQVILQQEIPLGFSLKPQKSRLFLIEMKGDGVPLRQDLGPVMQTEMRSENITLNFFFDTRYLIADRRSKWESNGCVVVAKPPLDSSSLGTMFKQDCYEF